MTQLRPGGEPGLQRLVSIGLAAHPGGQPHVVALEERLQRVQPAVIERAPVLLVRKRRRLRLQARELLGVVAVAEVRREVLLRARRAKRCGHVEPLGEHPTHLRDLGATFLLRERQGLAAEPRPLRLGLPSARGQVVRAPGPGAVAVHRRVGVIDHVLVLLVVHVRPDVVEDQLPQLAAGSLGLVGHPGTYPTCPRAVTQPVTLAIGPEGGWIPYEVEKLAAAGLQPVQLGERILRVETAVTALLARLF